MSKADQVEDKRYLKDKSQAHSGSDKCVGGPLKNWDISIIGRTDSI